MNTKDSCRRYIESHLTRSVILPCRGLEDPTSSFVYDSDALMRIGDRHDSEKPRSVPWFTDKIGEFLHSRSGVRSGDEQLQGDGGHAR